MKLDLINSFLSWRMRKRFHQIEFFMKYPHEVQHEALFDLLHKARNTEWGQHYDFVSIKSYEDFKNRIPLTFYEDIEPDINRMRKGERDVLWPGEIKWFAKSSGTTSSKSKFIPVSPQNIKDTHFKGGKDMLSIYCNNNPETTIFSGMGLRLGGSTYLNNSVNNSYYGDVSAIIIENLPFWVTIRSTPDNKISLMSEWEEKIEAIANTSVKEDVSSLAGVPSWMLVLLNRVLEKSGKENLHEVWPNLELYIHGGVNFTPYRQHFQKLLPDQNFSFLETYNASEGFFGIQDCTDREEMLLMLDYGIFYEFIPMSDYRGKDSDAVTLDQVQQNENYALVLTSNSGLWRYIPGDTVRFTSTDPYRIQVSGRTKHFINAFGEEVIIENAENAVRMACRKSGAEVLEYSAAPVYMDDKTSGAHEWIIEFTRKPENLQEFINLLDGELQNLNSDYEAKRYKSIALREPRVNVARQGLFYEWLKSKGKLGGQNKVPRLSNDRHYLDELLEMNQMKTAG